MSKVKAIPEGYHTITPYIIVNGAAKAIEFYKKAFNAIEVMAMPMGDGRIGHAEMKIGNSPIMLADEFPEMDTVGPQKGIQPPVMLHLYVEDVDSLFNQAIAAGATVLRPLQDQFYGDRSGSLIDPFGHVWYMATHIEDLTPEEIHERAKKAKHC